MLRNQVLKVFRFVAAIFILFQTAVHFGGRVLSCFAVMFRSNEFHHFHVAFWQANDASPSKSLVNTVLIFSASSSENRCAWQISAIWRQKRYARRDQRSVSCPWCRSFFVPSSSPPNAKTCTKKRTPSHFPQACWQCRLYWLFGALNAFAPKPAFLSFARLARLVMPSVFFVRWHIAAALLVVADFAFQARFDHFAKALKIGARAVAI